MTGRFETPLVIAVAPNGARKTKADHPALPITPDELARTAAACAEAGAAMIHLHVRDEKDGHSLDVARYRAAIAAIEAAVGDRIVIQITTEAVGIYTPEQQRAVVRAVRPPAASLAVRELCPDEESVAEAADFFAWMAQERVHPQFILYAPEDAVWFNQLRKRGVIPWETPTLLYVLGRYTKGQVSQPTDLLPFLAEEESSRPEDAAPPHWAICAFGPLEGACALAAAALNGHARVGFENNTLLSDGSTAPDNAALVAQVVAGAALIGRPIATAAETRALWGVAR
ncbi:MAG: 3-keto-5-aminohexanoate cleavage protein [Alphaproteobacteria bacterium]|nr:3-keto-5-aminohexanoate cleavage protein [Alphaproteobacteria bacterium]